MENMEAFKAEKYQLDMGELTHRALLETVVLPDHPQSFITLRHAHEKQSILETSCKMQSRAGKGSWRSGPDTQPGELLESLSSQAFPSPKEAGFHS